MTPAPVSLDIGGPLLEFGAFKIQAISPVLSKFIGLLLVAAAIAAFFYLIMGGIQWITSGGDKAGMQAAREKITAAFIGLAIVATAWAIFLLLQSFFGLNILTGPGNGPPIFRRCPSGDQGQPGETCENLNWCDIAGGCNRACCATDEDCRRAGGAPNCNILNGYCRSGKSCGT